MEAVPNAVCCGNRRGRSNMRNPILVEFTRGALVESRHAGAVAIVRPTGEVAAALGEIAMPVFPRSAIKPLQAIACVESGAADRFGFGGREIALASASHSGTQVHADLAQSMLERAGLSPKSLACGIHEPMHAATARALIRSQTPPSPLHHNCSGKHAAMLATAMHNTEPTEGYWRPDHSVQERIAAVLEDLTDCRLGADVRGIDGCSVPNWAISLRGLAQAFARFASADPATTQHAQACSRIAEACWDNPDLVAGPGRLDTAVMAKLAWPRAHEERRGRDLLRGATRTWPRLRGQDRRRREESSGGGGGAAHRALLPGGREPGTFCATHELARLRGRPDARFSGTGSCAGYGGTPPLSWTERTPDCISRAACLQERLPATRDREAWPARRATGGRERHAPLPMGRLRGYHQQSLPEARRSRQT